MSDYKVGELGKLFQSESSESQVVPAFASSVVTSTEKPKGEKAVEQVEEEEESDDETDEEKLEKDKRTIFVGNVPLSFSPKLEKLKAELKKQFGKFGEVESVRLRSLPIEKTAIPATGSYKTMIKASALKNKVEKTSTCNAYVVFKALDSVQAAVDMGQGMDFHGFHLRVDKASRDEDKLLFDRRRTVFVGNLAYDTTEESLREYFESKNGITVESVRLIRDKVTNQGKGFGYVLLKSNEMLEDALKIHGESFLKREIRVTRCQRSESMKKKKGGGKVTKFQGTTAQFHAGKRFRTKQNQVKSKAKALKSKKLVAKAKKLAKNASKGKKKVKK